MNRTRFTRGNASFVGIRETGSYSVLSDANKNEKDQTHAIDLYRIRALSKIVLAIKKRIDAGDNARTDATPSPRGTPNSSKTPSANSGKDFYPEETQER